MKAAYRNVLVGYVGFCAVNWAATYYAARSGSPVLLGSAGLLTLNESLRPLNLLARLVDPIAAAERATQGHPASVGATVAAPQFLPSTQTVMQNDGGVTTTFGP